MCQVGVVWKELRWGMEGQLQSLVTDGIGSQTKKVPILRLPIWLGAVKVQIWAG